MYTNPEPRNLSATAGMLASVAARKSPFGRVIVVSGPESLLADRAVDALRQQIQAEDADAEINEVEAGRLDRGKLTEMTSASLFASRRAAVITDAANLAPELVADVVALAAAALPELALVVVHGGGVKGKGLLDKLKAGGAEVIDCPVVKTWELPQFVSAEARRAGASIDPGAAQALVDAVGHDLRSLASAMRATRVRR